MSKVTLTETQEALQEHVSTQLRLFLSTNWEHPRFPWPLIVGDPHCGVTTTIASLNIPTLVLDVMQWSIIGGRGTPTLATIAKWAEQPVSIILLKNLHLLNANTLDVPWYKAVQTEMLSLLDGRANITFFTEPAEHQGVLNNLNKNVFFIGAGNWQAPNGIPLFTNSDAYRDSVNNDLTTPPELLCRFHSKPYVVSSASLSDWVVILKALLKVSEDAAISIAKSRMESGGNLSQIGEIISERLLDRPLPELKQLLEAAKNPTARTMLPKNTSLTRDRLKLLLCKIYGDVVGYKVLQKEVEVNINEVDNLNDVGDNLRRLVINIETAVYGRMNKDAKAYFLKHLLTAITLSDRIPKEQHVGDNAQ